MEELENYVTLIVGYKIIRLKMVNIDNKSLLYIYNEVNGSLDIYLIIGNSIRIRHFQLYTRSLPINFMPVVSEMIEINLKTFIETDLIDNIILKDPTNLLTIINYCKDNNLSNNQFQSIFMSYKKF